MTPTITADDEQSESLQDLSVGVHDDVDIDMNDNDHDEENEEENEENDDTAARPATADDTVEDSDSHDHDHDSAYTHTNVANAASTGVNTADTSTDMDASAAAAARHDRAVAQATASADAAYKPCAAILNSVVANDLVAQVDGLLLTNESEMEQYSSSTLTYQATNVPLKLRETLEIPIHVSTSGSVVQYKLTTLNYDIGFSIVAHRGFSNGKQVLSRTLATATTTNEEDDKEHAENDNAQDDDEEDNDNHNAATTNSNNTPTSDEVVLVRPMARVNAHERSIEGKFLVGTVPTRLVFTLDNSYSWFREKVVSYTIEVKPPSFTTIVSGRRRRAKAALHIVKQDQQSAALRLQKTQRYTNKLNQQMQALQKELDQKQTTLELAQQEESWLTTRVQVRAEQTAALETRLAQGWPDEMLLQTLKKKLARQEQTNLQSIPHSTTTRTRTATGTADEDVATVENEAPSPLIQENR
jgi:hypothetical protein